MFYTTYIVVLWKKTSFDERKTWCITPIWTLQHKYSEWFYFVCMSIVLIVFEKLKWFGYFFIKIVQHHHLLLFYIFYFFRRISNLTTIMNCTKTIRASVVQPQFCPFHTKKDFHSKSILMMMLMNQFLIQRFIFNWKCQNKLEFFRILRK